MLACVLLSSPIKFPARVLAVAHECDLAVLTVDNDDFWADTQGLLFGEVSCSCPIYLASADALLMLLLAFTGGTCAISSTAAAPH